MVKRTCNPTTAVITRLPLHGSTSAAISQFPTHTALGILPHHVVCSPFSSTHVFISHLFTILVTLTLVALRTWSQKIGATAAFYFTRAVFRYTNLLTLLKLKTQNSLHSSSYLSPLSWWPYQKFHPLQPMNHIWHSFNKGLAFDFIRHIVDASILTLRYLKLGKL